MIRSILAAALVAACLPVAAATAGSSSTGEHIFFPGDCIKNVYKPTSITIACADANFRVTKIKWRAYGTSSANGRGTAVVNTCTPTCVAGKFVDYPVSVRLSKPRQCGDVKQFSRIAVTFTAKRPKGMQQTETQTVRCADAPTR